MLQFDRARFPPSYVRLPPTPTDRPPTNPNPLTVLAPSLSTLRLDGNRIASLAPLSALPRLQALSAARNSLTSLRGLEGLTALRRLDAAYNDIGRLEDVKAVVGAALLGELHLHGNALQRAMGARFHTVYLLPQLQSLDCNPITAAERLAAADIHGAGAEELSAIRKRCFPNGELDDGGGAIPPTAAGLVPSAAEEERSVGGGGVEAQVYAPADALAASVGWEVALEGGVRAVVAQLLGKRRSSSSTGTNHRSSADSSATTAAAGIAACGPLRQLQLVRAIWSWVLQHVRPPARPAAHSTSRRSSSSSTASGGGRGTDDDVDPCCSCPELGTWQVDQPLFGDDEGEAGLEEVRFVFEDWIMM